MHEESARAGYETFRKAMSKAGEKHPSWDDLPEVVRDAYRRLTTTIREKLWGPSVPKTDLQFTFGSGNPRHAPSDGVFWQVTRKGQKDVVGYIVGMGSPKARFVTQGPGLTRDELEEIAIKLSTLPAHAPDPPTS